MVKPMEKLGEALGETPGEGPEERLRKRSGETSLGTRKLRSKSEDGARQNLFLFPADAVLLTKRLTLCQNTPTPPNTVEARLPPFPVNLVKHDTPAVVRKRRRPGMVDGVPDETYLLYHTRMHRREKQFANFDRDKMLTELDNYQLQLLRLSQADWWRYLPSITHIHNPNDHEELVAKRKLTMRALQSQVQRYHAWRAKGDRLKRGDLSEDEESDGDTATVEELRKRWMKKRVARLGPVIVVKMGDGRRLVVDPVYKPRWERECVGGECVRK